MRATPESAAMDMYVCGKSGCDKPAEAPCGCGVVAYHGFCDDHLEEEGWVRPEGGECWVHPEYWKIVRQNRWGDEAKYLLHRLYTVWGKADGDPWYVFDKKLDRLIELTAGTNGLPFRLVGWIYPRVDGLENLKETPLTAEYNAQEQKLTGFEGRSAMGIGPNHVHNTLFELYPEMPMVKVAAKSSGNASNGKTEA